jgi:hypothetical protein
MAENESIKMPETLDLDNSGLFDVMDDTLALETELEQSVDAGNEPEPELKRQVRLTSNKRKAMDLLIEEHLGQFPRWQIKTLQLATTPLIGTAGIIYDDLYSQMMANGLHTEAEILAAVVSGIFGIMKNGEVPFDFTKYDGDPSSAAIAMDKAGIIKLPKKLMTQGETFNKAFKEEAGSALSNLNPEIEKKFLKILNGKGMELGAEIKKKFPKYNETDRRVLNFTLGHRVAKEIKNAVRNADDQGNITYSGVEYNITDSDDVARMVKSVIKNKYPLKEQGTPSPKGKDVDGTRSITPELVKS